MPAPAQQPPSPALQETIANMTAPRQGAGDADDELDDDPIFLPQERLEQSTLGDGAWQRVGVPESGEERSDIFEERLARAGELKAEATTQLKAGRYALAKQVYRRAFHHADYNELERMQFAPQHEKMINDTQVPILLNLAQTTLKLSEKATAERAADAPLRSDKQLRACIAYCREVLKLEPDNVKALYRRALARERSGDSEDAVPDLRRARTLILQQHPHQKEAPEAELKAVLKALRRVTEQARVERRERASVWAGKLPPAPAPAPGPAAGEAVAVETKSATTPDPTEAGEEAVAPTVPVRPPLSSKGTWFDRTQTLRHDLLQKMGHSGSEAANDENEAGASDDGAALMRVSSGAAFRAFNKGGSGRITWKELAIGLDALKITVSGLENPITRSATAASGAAAGSDSSSGGAEGGGGDTSAQSSAQQDYEKPTPNITTTEAESLSWRRLLDRLDVDRDGRVTATDFRNFLGLDEESSSEEDALLEDKEAAQYEEEELEQGEQSMSAVLQQLIRPIYLPACLAAAAQALSYPLLSPLALSLSGGRAQRAGATLGLKAATTLICQFPASRLLPLLGNQRTSTLGISLEAAAALLTGMAARAGSLPILMVAQMTDGLGMCLWTVGRQSAMLELTPSWAVRPQVSLLLPCCLACLPAPPRRTIAVQQIGLYVGFAVLLDYSCLPCSLLKYPQTAIHTNRLKVLSLSRVHHSTMSRLVRTSMCVHLVDRYTCSFIHLSCTTYNQRSDCAYVFRLRLLSVCLYRCLYVILQRGRATAMYGGFIRCAIALCPALGGLLAADGTRPGRVFHVQALLAMVAAASLLIFNKKSTPVSPSSADHTAAVASTVWICVCMHSS